MKILMISSYLPFPLFSGGQVRLYNLLKELSLRHEITLICEKRENQTESDTKEIEKICHKVITVARRKQWTLQNIWSAAISSHSFLTTGHTNKEMRRMIKEELSINQYDLIHIETFYIAQNLPPTLTPVVLVEHNVEHLVYSRYAKNASVLLRPFLNIDVHKIKKEEEQLWKKVSKVVAVSDDDRKTMQSAGIDAAIVPNGVNPDQFSFKDQNRAISQREKKILFIGDFKWIQNRDSLSWIVNDIWPLIKEGLRKIPQTSTNDVKLWIVGRHIPYSIKSLTNDPDILFDEKSSTRPAQEIFQEAYILLAPIRSGGGTSYKILEALSVGTPVIITSLSARSLLARDLKEALIGDTAEELAEQTLRLLQNNDLYRKIGNNGRALIEEKYTWKAISRKLNEVYESIKT